MFTLQNSFLWIEPRTVASYVALGSFIIILTQMLVRVMTATATQDRGLANGREDAHRLPYTWKLMAEKHGTVYIFMCRLARLLILVLLGALTTISTTGSPSESIYASTAFTATSVSPPTF
jgi:hypothetical protein